MIRGTKLLHLMTSCTNTIDIIIYGFIEMILNSQATYQKCIYIPRRDQTYPTNLVNTGVDGIKDKVALFTRTIEHSSMICTV